MPLLRLIENLYESTFPVTISSTEVTGSKSKNCVRGAGKSLSPSTCDKEPRSI